MQSTVPPVSPNIPPAFQPSAASAAVLSKWPQTLAMIISSPMTTELSAAVTALGDQLAANGWIEAAHAWYVMRRSRHSHLLTCFNAAIYSHRRRH